MYNKDYSKRTSEAKRIGNSTQICNYGERGNLMFYVVTLVKDKDSIPYSKVLTSYELRELLKTESLIVTNVTLLNDKEGKR
jgi:hypothetical protein